MWPLHVLQRMERELLHVMQAKMECVLAVARCRLQVETSGQKPVSTGGGRPKIGTPSRPDAYAPRSPTMANGGSRRGLYGEGRRLAVAPQVHSPPHVQSGQAGSQRGRPIGRATHRKSDPSEERQIGKGDPSEGRPIGRLEGYNFRWEG